MFWPATVSLASIGLVGVAVFAATAPPQLLNQIPIRGSVRKRLLISIQPALLVILLAAAGAAVSDAASSKSLIVDFAAGNAAPDRWIGSLLGSLGTGMVLGAALYLLDRWWRPWWGTPADVDLIMSWRPQSVVSGATYGGVTEEVMMRWGLMGVIIWALAAVTGNQGDPTSPIVFSAIVVSAILFAAGHLPGALLGKPRSTRLVVRIMALNTVAGLLFGWLFWRWNLETAMAAHVGFHIGAALLVIALRRRGGAYQT